MANVVGKKLFESLCWRQKVSQFVTVSDEALALLMYENNYERWTDMGKNGNWKSSAVRPKYTLGGNACQTPKSGKCNAQQKKLKKGASKPQLDDNCGNENNNDSTCARYQGWSLEGFRKYNMIFDAVKAECASPLGAEFDEAFLLHSKEYKDDNDKKQKKDASLFEVCRHELWDVNCTSTLSDVFNQNANLLMNNYTIVSAGEITLGCTSLECSENDLGCKQSGV